MILARLGRAFEPDQVVDGLTAPAVRGWIVGLQATLAPVSIAGYVRTMKVFGNWLHAEELADAAAFRGLRKPRVPMKLIEPVPDDTLRRSGRADPVGCPFRCLRDDLAAVRAPRRAGCTPMRSVLRRQGELNARPPIPAGGVAVEIQTMVASMSPAADCP